LNNRAGAYFFQKPDINLHSVSEHCEAMTGNYFTRDVQVQDEVTPAIGTSHLLSAHVQGALRGYYAGLDGEGKAAILCNNSGIIRLAETSFNWEMGCTYQLAFTTRVMN